MRALLHLTTSTVTAAFNYPSICSKWTLQPENCFTFEVSRAAAVSRRTLSAKMFYIDFYSADKNACTSQKQTAVLSAHTHTYTVLHQDFLFVYVVSVFMFERTQNVTPVLQVLN